MEIQLFIFTFFIGSIKCWGMFDNERVCDGSAELCGSRCYDPATQYCDESNLKICRIGEQVCGKRHCYTPHKETCHGRTVCPKGELPCDRKCYAPNSFYCTENKVVCRIGEITCNLRCYNNTTQVCANKEDGIVCSIGQEVCGNKCFTPSPEEACKGRAYVSVICKRNQEACGFKCFDPQSGKKCYPYFLLCNPGEEPCGFKCMKTGEEKCFDLGRGLKKICSHVEGFEQIMCGFWPYWTHNETCYTRRRYVDFPCPNTKKPCGYDCYEEGKEVCITFSGYLQKVCNVGNELCGVTCFDPNAGRRCIGRTLCQTHEDACGYTCYDPKIMTTKTCLNNTALCDNGQELCGRRCFTPVAQKCISNRIRKTFTRYEYSSYEDYEEDYV